MENERVKYQACPLCESGAIQVHAKVDCTGHARWHPPLEPFMVWMACTNCDHVFTEGYFTNDALSVLFESTNEEQIVGLDIESQRYVSARMVQRVIENIGLPHGRLWVDVGFGNGSLLMTAKEFGFDVFGLDLRRKNVEDVAGFGIPAHYGTLESSRNDVDWPVRPTVISMADVVEHEPFPIRALQSARALIDDAGVLLISMPNASSPLWRYWNANGLNPYWHEIEHYHNFTRERLYAVLEQAGFKPVHYAISERYRGCMEVLARAV